MTETFDYVVVGAGSGGSVMLRGGHTVTA